MGDTHAYAESLPPEINNTTVYVDKTILTFTSNADDYIIIAAAEGHTAANIRLVVDGAAIATGPWISVYGSYIGFGQCVKKTLTAASHTIKIQWRTYSVGNATIRNAKIFAVAASLFSQVASTNPSDTSFSGSWTDFATLTFNALSGNYLIISSLRTSASGGYFAQWRLVDADSTVLGEASGYQGSLVTHEIVFDVVTLQAGSNTFKLQGYGAVVFDSIWLLALKLPDDYKFARNDDLGSGTRAHLAWTPVIGHEIFALEMSEAVGDVAYYQRSFKRDTTTLNEASHNVFSNYASSYNTINGSTFFTSTGNAENFTNVIGGISMKNSRILALDLSTLIVSEPVEALPELPFVDTHVAPQIVAETMEGFLPIVAGEITRSSGSELSNFWVRVWDEDRVWAEKITKWEPIWIWMKADVKKRFWYRIEDLEIVEGTNGRLIELAGRSWGAHIMFRGNPTDSTLSNREVTDIIGNPTDGLLLYVPEVGATATLQSVGETLTTYEEPAGQKVWDAVIELAGFGSRYYTFSPFICDGEHENEWGAPSFHFQKALSTLSPVELVEGRSLEWVFGRSNRDIARYEIIESGDWGYTDITVTQPDVGDVIDSYSETNKNSDIALYSGSAVGVGQALTPSSDVLCGELRWYLKKVGGPTGNIIAKIYKASGVVGTSAIPTGTALAISIPVSIASLTTSYALVRFPLINPVLLGGFENYVVTVEYSGGNGSNYLHVGVDV